MWCNQNKSFNISLNTKNMNKNICNAKTSINLEYIGSATNSSYICNRNLLQEILV